MRRYGRASACGARAIGVAIVDRAVAIPPPRRYSVFARLGEYTLNPDVDRPRRPCTCVSFPADYPADFAKLREAPLRLAKRDKCGGTEIGRGTSETGQTDEEPGKGEREKERGRGKGKG